MPLLLLNGTRWQRKHGTGTRERERSVPRAGWREARGYGETLGLQQSAVPSGGRQAVSRLPCSSAWIPAPSAPRDLPYLHPLSTLPCKAPPSLAQATEELRQGWFLGGTGPLPILPIPSETNTHFYFSPRPLPSTLDAATSPRELGSLPQRRGAPRLQSYSPWLGQCSQPAPRPLLPQACPCPEARTPAHGSGSLRLPFLTAAFSVRACPAEAPEPLPNHQAPKKTTGGKSRGGSGGGPPISCVTWTHLWPLQSWLLERK